MFYLEINSRDKVYKIDEQVCYQFSGHPKYAEYQFQGYQETSRKEKARKEKDPFEIMKQIREDVHTEEFLSPAMQLLEAYQKEILARVLTDKL